MCTLSLFHTCTQITGLGVQIMYLLVELMYMYTFYMHNHGVGHLYYNKLPLMCAHIHTQTHTHSNICTIPYITSLTVGYIRVCSYYTHAHTYSSSSTSRVSVPLFLQTAHVSTTPSNTSSEVNCWCTSALWAKQMKALTTSCAHQEEYDGEWAMLMNCSRMLGWEAIFMWASGISHMLCDEWQVVISSY